MPVLSSVDFAQPLALLALLLLVPIAWAARHAARRGAAADAAYGGPAEVRPGVTRWRRRARVALAFGALVLLAIALARPRWGRAQVPIERRGIDVVIALDVSRSMSASDVPPTRAQAAADALQTLVTHLQGDRVGLVTFAGTAFARAPLTTDLGAIEQLIARAQSDSPLVAPGTDLPGAVESSLKVLDVSDPATSQVIVLVSDGEDRLGQSSGSAMQQALQDARDHHVPVYTAVAGTTAGGPLTDAAAQPGEMSYADPGVLQSIAQQTGGSFRQIDTVAGLAVDFQRMSQSLFDKETQRAPVERFQWFLGAALLLLLTQAALADTAPRRRPSARSLALGALLVVAMLAVSCGSTALYRAVADGNAAYADGRYDVALTHYQDASTIAPDNAAVLYDLGATLNQLHRYDESNVTTTKGLAQVQDPDVAFRLQYLAGANAFQRGALEDARSAYIAALRDHPDDVDAKANLELVLRALAPQQQDQQQGQDQQNQQNQQDQGGQQQSQPGQGQGQGQGQPGQQPDQQTPVGTPTVSPGQPDQSASSGSGGGSAQPGTAGTPSAGGGASSADNGQPLTAEQQEAARAAARAALARAVADLGPNVSLEDALRILNLAQQSNELQSLLAPRGGSPPER